MILKHRRNPHRLEPARDRLLLALAGVCLLGVTGTLTVIALYGDRFVLPREALR